MNGDGVALTTNPAPTVTAPPPWSPPDPPQALHVTTDEDQKAWIKAMRFCALWQEVIVCTGTVTSSSFPGKLQHCLELTVTASLIAAAVYTR